MGDAGWWQRGVIYQIYPRSFMDSDGDGVGDLPGILERLDHLTWLGVDAIWLSPIHPSPMDDFGYDVSDYTGVDPVFGTLADLDELVAAAHGRGLRVMLDWVPNHTSDQHPWFKASRASRDSPKRDWYIWRDPRPGGGPPSNWLRYVGDSAWRWDEPTGQFYYRVFLDSQPDLNWRNPAVQEAMFDTLRFWLARGIDGYIDRYLAALPAGAWPNWVLGNHDTPRAARRLGPAQARVAAMLLLTLPGTPILYQGEELGLGDVPIPPGQALDPIARLVPGRGRDPERTPMPWDAGPGAGFTTGRPWLPLGQDNLALSVAAQRHDPGSMLALHRRLLRLRRRAPALVAGAYHPVQADGDVLAYLRTDPGGDRYLVALNLGPFPARLAVPGPEPDAQVVMSTAPDRDGEPVAGLLDLGGDEGMVLSLAGHADAVQATDRDRG